jgi:hypothetical protein
MSMGTQSGSSSSSGFPLDNLTYDLITMIYEKSKGLEAFDKYMRDAQGNQGVTSLLKQMRQQDEQCIQQLQQHLHQCLMNQGGQSSRSVGGSSGSMSGSSGSSGSKSGSSGSSS